MSQKIKISDLKPHKENDFLFDDIQGEAWQEFVNSVETSGVIEPIVITQDKIIVSGHQRVRACKALGIEEIDAEVRIFDTDDEILKCLIETNIRQRGIGNTNPVKFGRCLKELERIYGIQHGGDHGNQYAEANPQIADLAKSQEDLAAQFGISVDTLNRYKQLADMIPEIQTLVETGIVTPTTARAIIKKLPEFQQRELAEQLASKEKKSTNKEVEEEIEKLKAMNEELKRDNKEQQDYIEELENQEPEVKTPDDYEDLKQKAELAKTYKDDFTRMKEAYDAMAEKWKQSEAEKQKMIDEADKPEVERTEKIKKSALMFCAGVSNFIEKYGGYVWLAESINEMQDSERKGYLSAINAIESWVMAVKSNMEGVIA